MSNCVRCGRDSYGVDSNGLCENCASTAGGIGTPSEVPCQRCGMYLPPHELRMHNSRLYCAYCIMDIQDEDKRAQGRHSEPSEQAEPGGGLTPESRVASGNCERCGKQSDVLYSVSGQRLCPQCYFEGGGVAPSRPSGMGQVVSAIRSFLGIKAQPKIISGEQQQVFDLRTRRMVDKKEGGKPENPDEMPAAQGGKKPGNGSPPPSSGTVFDLKDRKLAEKKEGLEAQHPITEGKSEEKKPPAKPKKVFFNLHQPTTKGKQ